ncbi:MAG: hypothetical protein OHK0052_11730 [Anaerolineales bacterium]
MTNPPRYENFEILIGMRQNQSAPLTLTQSPAGDASAACILDPNAPDIQTALERLEENDLDSQLLQKLGKRLLEGIFRAEINNRFSASLNLMRQRAARLRLRLRIEDPGLANLPWELLYLPDEDSFLGVSAETSIVRYPPVGAPPNYSPIRPPLRILTVIANPTDLPPLDVASEKNSLLQAFEKLIQAQQAELHFIESATPQAVHQAISTIKPHIFHFIGHAIHQNGQGYAILETETQTAQPVDELTFRELFTEAADLRLAVLNACQTGSSDETRALSGLAPRLLQRQIAAVIAMRYPLSDRAGIIFSRALYTALTQGQPLEAAVNEARRSVYIEIGAVNRYWCAPMLFLRAPTGNLFTQPDDATTTHTAGQGLNALAQLLQNTGAQTAIIAFRTDFQAASHQLTLLSHHKRLHDLFQELASRYALIDHDRRRLPADESAWESLELNEPELRAKIEELLAAAGESPAQNEDDWWVEQLNQSRTELRQAIEAIDHSLLQTPIRRLHRILDRQPSRVNAQLVSAASTLRLDTIVQALNQIVLSLPTTPTDILRPIRDGAQALTNLDQRLRNLVNDHNNWQTLEDELRRIENNLLEDLTELELSWTDIQTLGKRIFHARTEEWAVELQTISAELTVALNDNAVIKVKRTFRRFRSQSGRRFRQVDLDLLNLTQELRALGDSLNLLLQTLQS